MEKEIFLDNVLNQIISIYLDYLALFTLQTWNEILFTDNTSIPHLSQ